MPTAPTLFEVCLSWIDDEAEVHPVCSTSVARTMLREFAGVPLIVKPTPHPGWWLAELHPDWQATLREIGRLALSTDQLEDALECEWSSTIDWPTGDTRPLAMRFPTNPNYR